MSIKSKYFIKKVFFEKKEIVIIIRFKTNVIYPKKFLYFKFIIIIINFYY